MAQGGWWAAAVGLENTMAAKAWIIPRASLGYSPPLLLAQNCSSARQQHHTHHMQGAGEVLV